MILRGNGQKRRRDRAAAIACQRHGVIVSGGGVSIAQGSAGKGHGLVAAARVFVRVINAGSRHCISADQCCRERLQVACRGRVSGQAVVGLADARCRQRNGQGRYGADGATGTGAGQNVIADVRSADGQTLHRHGFSGRGVLVAVRAVGRIAQRDGVARLYPGQSVVAGGKVGGGIGAVVHLGDGVGEAGRQGLGINRQDTVGVAGSGNYIVFFIGTGQVTIRA